MRRRTCIRVKTLQCKPVGRALRDSEHTIRRVTANSSAQTLNPGQCRRVYLPVKMTGPRKVILLIEKEALKTNTEG